MNSPTTDRRQGHRRVFTVLVAIGLVVVGLGIGGVGAVLARGAGAADIASSTPSSTPEPSRSPRSPDRETSHPSPAETPRAEPSPTPDPHALADGVYPTFVRDVDVEGGTIVVDVLQLFVGEDAHRAAIEDGWDWEELQYNPVYIRNENPLLRSLPVARDVHVILPGLCDSRDRSVGLAKLREVIWPFNEGFYYDVTVVDGTVERIAQQVAIAGC